MLSRINIQDFAIIDALELDLAGGMTVLSGETGAGKSILVDALGLVLGDRADSAMVRHGQTRAEVSAAFDTDADIQQWLADHDLDADSECLLRRTVSAEGRSRAYVNGRPVPAQTLRELGERLVDIHGQHAHQSLLRPATQREILDDYGRNGPLLTQVADTYRHWRELDQQREQLALATTERQSRLDLLRYQSGELDDLALQDGELSALEQERHTAANSTRLLEAAAETYDTLNGDQPNAIIAGLGRSGQRLRPLVEHDPRLKPITDLLDSALIQAEEAGTELRGYLDGLEVDPQRLEAIEQRLQRITDLARKHQVSPEQLPKVLETMLSELDGLENLDTRLAELDQELQVADDAYRAAAGKLSQSRTKAAKKLAKAVTANMQKLGMAGGIFEIHLAPLDQPGPTGMEAVELRVSANPGQPPRPLARVASGGELSRISLSLQVLISERLGVPTLIFDEVDVGIGGGVAEIVGRLLRRLGSGCQVLCVTHLPQVAAQGHQHLFVSKRQGKTHTGSAIETLQDQARVREIARMLGGVDITDTTLSHADELLRNAQKEA
jgi:DNA repair protein RecN (Recombination protein N)